MKDIEELISNADFTTGCNHKKKLHRLLFETAGNKDGNVVYGKFLSDDELDLAAAGTGDGMPKQAVAYCPECKKNTTFKLFSASRGICTKCGYKGMI